MLASVPGSLWVNAMIRHDRVVCCTICTPERRAEGSGWSHSATKQG
jgi:hypothetical protein